MKKLFQHKVFKLTTNIIKGIIYLFLLCFVIVVLLQRVSNNRISFFNYRMFTVVSPSMEPKYVVGDVLISKYIKGSDIKVGDNISYLGERGDFKDKVITHSVVNIYKDEKGKYTFHAKGLKNLVEDPIINESQIYGKVVYKSLILSYVYKVVGTKLGFFLFIIIPVMFILGFEIITTLLEKEDSRRTTK